MSNPTTSESWNIIKWCRGNPFAAALVLAIAGTFFFFFGSVHLFVNASESAADWAMKAWNPEQDQEHSWIVPFVFIGLIYYHWEAILKAPKRGSPIGLAFAGFGVLLFLLSTRCLEPRIALLSLPFLIFGSVLYVLGKDVARILMFPCAFLIFLIPFGVIQQATFKLQFIITGTVSMLANMVGISNTASGTTLTGHNGSFHFDVAEGCSGIHSIIAITMLSTIFMHLTQSQLWKKVVIVFSSVVFAIIGNIGRIFTILLVAKLFNANIAAGPYHTLSGYIIYPFAIAAMIGLSMLLNMHADPDQPSSPSVETPTQPKPRPGRPSYDYDY